MRFPSTVDAQDFHRLRHPAVRDLAWCCLSSPLLRQLPGSDTQHLPPLASAELWPWLFALDDNPQPLEQLLSTTRSSRLGIYYENLWRFYFSQAPQWELLAYNLPVNQGKVTLGAFDFLCRHQNHFWHIETAVKFYLCDTRDASRAQEWHHWVGPNAQDRLDIKLRRLRDHQLPLHQTPEGKAVLQSHFPEARHWHSGMCLQGYLFSSAPDHLQPEQLRRDRMEECLLHPGHNHDFHGAGFWWYKEDFLHWYHNHHTHWNSIKWIVLERHEWLAPVQGSDLSERFLVIRDALPPSIEEMKRPLMIAAVEPCPRAQGDDQWREFFRGFIQPDDWPASPEQV